MKPSIDDKNTLCHCMYMWQLLPKPVTIYDFDVLPCGNYPRMMTIEAAACTSIQYTKDCLYFYKMNVETVLSTFSSPVDLPLVCSHVHKIRYRIYPYRSPGVYFL